MSKLLIEFSDGTEISVSTDGGSVVLSVENDTLEVPRHAVESLKEALEGTETRREQFFRTAGEYRQDGSYRVERRGADSSGNSAVFDSFDAARRLFERLPDSFDASDLEMAGFTGSRRHMLVRHFAEHPAFACELESRNPLVARKTEEG